MFALQQTNRQPKCKVVWTIDAVKRADLTEGRSAQNPAQACAARRSRLMLAVVAVGLLSFLVAGPAFAGTSAAGEPLFYPCTSCHPLVKGASTKDLPNGFKAHQITLEQHDVLGEGRAACTVCHAEADADPGKLKLVDGTLVDITSPDVSKVCYPCHASIYNEFVDGMHGTGLAGAPGRLEESGRPKCTASGCHDPHTPGYITGKALLPFVGVGFQAHVLPEQEPYTPFAGLPSNAPHHDPEWLVLLAMVGVVAAGGIAGTLIRGRSSR